MLSNLKGVWRREFKIVFAGRRGGDGGFGVLVRGTLIYACLRTEGVVITCAGWGSILLGLEVRFSELRGTESNWVVRIFNNELAQRVSLNCITCISTPLNPRTNELKFSQRATQDQTTGGLSE